MLSHKKWFFTGLVVMVAELTLVALVNYIVDPYGIFRYGTWRRDVSHQFIGPNMNFIKTRYVARSPEKFDCLIFGSSRVRGIDGRQMKGATCYNMSYPDGLPRNHLDNLRYLLNRGARPKIVLIGLDEFSYKRDPEKHFIDYGKHPYPSAVRQNTCLFYLKYLIRYSSRSKKAFRAFFGKSQPFPYDHYGTGLLERPAIDRMIESDVTKHVRDQRFHEPMITEGDRIKQSIAEINELVILLQTHGIRPVIFMNPVHKATYIATDLEKHFLFEKGLSKITPFYDFSGLNSVTTNNYYYYETSHYRPNVGRLMLARMFNDHDVQVPDDFGTIVDESNIENHLVSLKNQIAGFASH